MSTPQPTRLTFPTPDPAAVAVALLMRRDFDAAITFLEAMDRTDLLRLAVVLAVEVAFIPGTTDEGLQLRLYQLHGDAGQ